MARLRSLFTRLHQPVTDTTHGGPDPSGSEPEVPGYTVDVEHPAFDEVTIRLSGQIHADNAGHVLARAEKVLHEHPHKNVAVNLTDTEYFDSSGIAILVYLKTLCRQQHAEFSITDAPPRVEQFLDVHARHNVEDTPTLAPRLQPDVMSQIGGAVLKVGRIARNIITFLGACAVALGRDLAHPREIRWDNPFKLLERAGVDAVPIVGLLSFLMGAILAFQGAIQLRKFGANIFVADLVSVAICVEMGPLMAAMIAAGRSGAAYAAHIGTMQVTEEVDALRVLALDPIRYLVTPRIIAVAIALPCLTLIGDILGTIGGCVVAVLSLDLTPTTYFNQVQKVLQVSDVLKGLVKSFVFGIEIAVIGCLWGFEVRGGAEAVGRATTSTVVTSIFVLTVTDALFAVVYHYVRFF